MLHCGIVSRIIAPPPFFYRVNQKLRSPESVDLPVELYIAKRSALRAQIFILEVARKRLVTFLHEGGCFGVKMSDKLLTFSRHKNKTRNAATLGPASWQEEHQVLAIPANQRTSRSVTVLLSAFWRVFESRLGQYLSNSLAGVIKKPGGVVRDSERRFTG